MPFARTLLAAIVFAPMITAAQPPTDTDRRFTVAYVEAAPSAASAARSALERYRDAVRQQPGCLGVELFAQDGRPGRFVVLESWRAQSALDGRDDAAKRDLLEALEPIRVSGYDERPYKPLTLARRAANTGPDVVVIAHVDVAPNTQAPELLRRLAEASRGEAGNLDFDVLQHAQRGNHFTVIEHWRDQAALDEHVQAAHTREYRDALQPLTGSPLDERVYTLVAPGR